MQFLFDDNCKSSREPGGPRAQTSADRLSQIRAEHDDECVRLFQLEETDQSESRPSSPDARGLAASQGEAHTHSGDIYST